MLASEFNDDHGTSNARKLSLFANVNAFTLHMNKPARITESSSSTLTNLFPMSLSSFQLVRLIRLC